MNQKADFQTLNDICTWVEKSWTVKTYTSKKRERTLKWWRQLLRRNCSIFLWYLLLCFYVGARIWILSWQMSKSIYFIFDVALGTQINPCMDWKIRRLLSRWIAAEFLVMLKRLYQKGSLYSGKGLSRFCKSEVRVQWLYEICLWRFLFSI